MQPVPANDDHGIIGEYVTTREAFDGVCDEIRDSGVTGLVILLLFPASLVSILVGIGVWFLGL